MASHCASGDLRRDGRPDPRFPTLPNAPFRIDAPPVNGRADAILLNPIHAFYHNQEQINGTRNNMFAAMSNVGGWTMGYFGNAELRLMQWRKSTRLRIIFQWEHSAAPISIISG